MHTVFGKLARLHKVNYYSRDAHAPYNKTYIGNLRLARETEALAASPLETAAFKGRVFLDAVLLRTQ